MNDASIANCVSLLRNISWENVLNSNDAGNAYKLFNDNFQDAINKAMPIKQIKINKKKDIQTLDH